MESAPASNIFSRMVGFILIFAAVLGIAISIWGLAVIWRAEAVAEDTVLDMVDLMDRTLTVTGNLLVVMDESLDNVDSNVALIEISIRDMGASLDSTARTMNTMADIAGNDLTRIVEQTQTALNDTQRSAKVIDDFLSLISRLQSFLAFFGGNTYDPDVPLSQTIQGVSGTLNELPGNLRSIQEELNTTSSNFDTLRADMVQLEENIAGIKTNLAGARAAVEDYQLIVNESKEKLETVRNRLHGWVRAIVWGGTAMMIWLFFAQVGLFMQGLEKLGRAVVRERRVEIRE